MILSIDELARRRPRIPGALIATSGGFDPLHVGHLRCLLAARALGDALVVIVNGDGYLLRKKGYAFMPLADRMEILDALRCVDYVVPYDDGTQVVSGAVEAIRPSAFAKGVELARPEELPEWQACQAVGCEVRLLVGGPKVRSSSEMISHLTLQGGRKPQRGPAG